MKKVFYPQDTGGARVLHRTPGHAWSGAPVGGGDHERQRARSTLTFELRANDEALLSQGSRVAVTVLARYCGGGGGDDGCSTSRRTPARTTGTTLVISAAFVRLLHVSLLARCRRRPSR